MGGAGDSKGLTWAKDLPGAINAPLPTLRDWSHQACCGFVSNDGCGMSVPRGAVFTVSAPPPPDRNHAAQQVLCPWGISSNAQHDQLNKSDADQQHRKRHVIVFEPMPIIGKHHVDPSIRTPKLSKTGCRKLSGGRWATVLLIDMYRTPVSGVFRRKDSGFAVCGENPASVSRFVAGIRRGRSFKHEEETPSPGLVSSVLRCRQQRLLL